MLEVAGIVLFALGIFVSLCLHEAGHMATARAFGMKVTRFFIGYGPTLWSFRRGETEYGVKAIPAGAFVRIVGMIRDDGVAPADEARAMWRYPLWKRTAVMLAGCGTHVVFGVFLLWILFAFVPLPDEGRLQSEPVRVAGVSGPASAAAAVGLAPGDVITAIDGAPVRGWDAMVATVRAAGGERVEVTFVHDGQVRTGAVTLPVVDGAGMLGVTPVVPESTAGPIGGIGKAADQAVVMFEGVFGALQRFPEKVPELISALSGEERPADSPISVVGASRIGGELADQGEWAAFLLLLAALNLFYGVFNLLPVLPLDGGHIAVWWFERARFWVYARLRRRDPGPVDYYKLMPVVYVAILLFAGITLLTVAADLVNPVTVQ
jgi:membrane-associated protease RseP (regulator of RpoE activity)